MTARSLMVLGTASHVGKSLTTAALCRIFARAGLRVAPFKAQNMSLNSAATPDGLEIGRAQALQAEAARVSPSVHMNPVLIKPGSDTTAQIVVRGKVWQTLDAQTYHNHRAITLLPIVEESYRELAATSDVVVLEGAGSPAEINLKDNDIVNMRMARVAQAPCLLVGDIDRGGVFASLLGTCALLDNDERRHIRGFLVNKFRGDQSLLMPGVRTMEQRLEIPCMGIVPWLHKLDLDEEDSVGFAENTSAEWDQASNSTRLRIAVIAFPSISNFTDFAPLLAEPSVSLRYVREPAELPAKGLVILPGSKQTTADLNWLRRQGLEQPLIAHAKNGGLLVGICGGFQMLGQDIFDRHGVEGGGSERGLALLPVTTTLEMDKVTTPAHGALSEATLFGTPIERPELRGYEIHVGKTAYLPDAIPFARIHHRNAEEHEFLDGCVSISGRVWGTYLHGIFDQDAFRHTFLKAARTALHMPPATQLFNWRQHREQQLDRLADTFAAALDLNAIFGLLGRIPT